jgi:hypothetical protein
MHYQERINAYLENQKNNIPRENAEVLLPSEGADHEDNDKERSRWPISRSISTDYWSHALARWILPSGGTLRASSVSSS